MTGRREHRGAPDRLAGIHGGRRRREPSARRTLAGFALAVAIGALVALAIAAARADAGTTPTPDPAPAALVCARGFPWFRECWTKNEGAAFSRALREHGVNPAGWAKRHPELARTFGNGWPGPDWPRLDRSFSKALHHAAAHWKVSYSWLYACAASEGGTNPSYFAIGTHNDSGWFQFLPSTWAWMSNGAWQAGRGANPPLAYKHIRSVVGQTWTAAWAFSRGLSYHWFGRGC